MQKHPPEVFYKKGVVKNFTKFAEKHRFQNLFFNKVASLRPSTLFKKEALAQVFSCEFFVNFFFKNIFFAKHLQAAAALQWQDHSGKDTEGTS